VSRNCPSGTFFVVLQLYAIRKILANNSIFAVRYFILMLTNNDSKLINSLVKKKFRQKYNKFTVEGVKIIREVIKSNVKIEKIFTTEDLFQSKNVEIIPISESELKKISNQVQPNTALALCEIPVENEIQKDGMILALNDIPSFWISF